MLPDRAGASSATYPPHGDDDAGLIADAQGGNLTAFTLLIERHSAVAYRVAYLITHSAADAGDSVQDAFWNCYRAIHRIRPGAAMARGNTSV